ncbi:tetratricopeptide repeat protein [Calothrix sp. 336/3]|uniref:tetratricopeptide repeat protein n=1 Tax=Calothrix sp. 336/3 TaxID=1337936 RepID=UPI0004E46AB9|nr:tetratricopeptide repeat protein [Calothrix sp. 336/3]AKG22607.1 hypothetical protein IJ00_16215 [Calothrix sp. 336/3]
MRLNDTKHTDSSSRNRQVYQRLKLAFGLGLRRQLFIGVCDDLNLRNQLAARLHSTLAYPVGQVLYQQFDTNEASTPAYPRLVTLRLNLSDPNPIAQINQWLTNYPPPMIGGGKDTPGRSLPIPSFQIVGVEQLTRQPVAIQRLFLHYLRLTEQLVLNPEANRVLDSGLLLWVPRPWLHAIQQSAPQFWRCRTGVFSFVGEPTPTTQTKTVPERFPDNRKLDFPLEGLEESLLGEAIADDDFDFPSSDTPANRGHKQEEANPIQSEVFIPEIPEKEVKEEITASSIIQTSPDLPQLGEINQELTELVLATLNSAIANDGELVQQIQQTLGEITTLHTQQASGAALGTAYHRLGSIYRLQVEQGHSTLENLMVAILAYQEAINHDENSPQVADTLNDLGTLYWMLYRTPPNLEAGQAYIQQGIEFYQLALKIIAPEEQADTYARVQNNLGTAYGDLAKFTNPTENWQKAVTAYSEALRFRTPDMDGLKYAATQNNLGTAYWHLAQYNQPVIHLQLAIAAYNSALAHYHPEQEPLKYGMIQNNIGTAHWNLAQYDNPPENLRQAIDAYCQALQYRTAAAVPTACAATQNNLGTAYWHLANQSQTSKEERQKFLELSLDAYKESLALAHSLKGISLSFDIFATHNNLGLAYYQLATDQYFHVDKHTRSHYLESSLDNHLQALNGFSKKPDAYQSTFNYVVKTIRAFHSELGLQGQNLALSKVPGQLLPEILPKL